MQAKWFMGLLAAGAASLALSAAAQDDTEALLDSVLGPAQEGAAPATAPPAAAPATQPAEVPAPAATPAVEQDVMVQLIQKASEAGSGVIIRNDENGRVKGLIVVGQAPISTVFGATRAQSLARQKASQDARAKLVQWMNDAVEVRETGENEYAIFIEGAAGGPAESGKAVEKTSTTFRSVASGLVRGLSLKGQHIDPQAKSLSVIYIWTYANALEAKRVAESDANLGNAPTGKDDEVPTGTTVVPSGKDLDRLIDE